MSERSYRQICGVARALDVLGGRWTLLIVRNLLVGPMRYSELLDTLPGITTNLLADRLKHLAASDVILKTGQRPYAEYRLSARGEALRPIILGLGDWGSTVPLPEGAAGNLRWALLSLTRTRRPKFTDCAILQQRSGRSFILRAEPQSLTLEDTPSLPVSVTFEGLGEAFLALFFRKQSPEALIQAGALSLTGTARAQARWLKLLREN